jgi:hypothetical protein
MAATAGLADGVVPARDAPAVLVADARIRMGASDGAGSEEAPAARPQRAFGAELGDARLRARKEERGAGARDATVLELTPDPDEP